MRAEQDKQTLPDSAAQVIATVEQRIGATHPQIMQTFRQCYPNSFETTTQLLDDGTTFIISGDIPAMWLRDASAQVRPYVKLAATDPIFRQLVTGIIRRQAMYILIDAYANAFNKTPNGQGHQHDRTAMGPWIWERKFELDSLCYAVQLCKDYWDTTHDQLAFDTTVHQMFQRILELMRVEQHHERDSTYTFQRPFSWFRPDTLPRCGKGTPVTYTGMVWSGFRPSDDACRFGFHIPSNMFAVVVLGHIIEFAEQIYHDPTMAQQAAELRDAIDQGIQTHGMVNHPRHGQIYAYETDGFGHHNLMDDANVPSLLSIPYLGYRPADDPVYLRTRAFVLSRDNPYYAEGTYARGVGSPHTPRGYVWPIGLIMQGLTSRSLDEQQYLLDTLASTTAGTGYMHESFHPDRPERFTRSWFAWANSLFGSFVCRWAGIDTF